MTVGYGDILPITFYEKLLICMILVLGVAIFSFFLSSMANQFAEIQRSASKRKVRF
jgi:hypothetical protein